ncbi:MAG: SUMF1/EgtB/PvdO family nonheme iron enzyme, partial [Lentisphaeria bacterium]|nr:SUMF1/EgtB/PvdO family nonheme iron enzyme [Lentisphaeria bacterium]
VTLVITPAQSPSPPRPAANPQQPWQPPGCTEKALADLEAAVRHLLATRPEACPDAPGHLERIGALRALDAVTAADTERRDRLFADLHREALLAHPLLPKRMLLVRRAAGNLALPANWQSHSSLPQTGHANAVCILTRRPSGWGLADFYVPSGGRYVGQVDLHWDASRMLVSMPGSQGRWRVWEIGLPDASERELPLVGDADVDNYDACYLPDGGILFTSTASFTGVPCVQGSSHVSTLFLYRPESGAIRQLGFDQDHNWCPTVLPGGRVLYLRWEYSDIPHFVSRILFQMNPDGTGQAEFLGSNSYWPNSVFFARPVPGHATRVVGIVSGHHDTARMGELVVFDPARGRHEADSVVQRVPGRGHPVLPVIRDALVGGSWPKFLNPWPLSETTMLVACKPGPASRWGIYLADTFDNLLLLHEEPDLALLEPIPLQPRPVPPVVPTRCDPGAAEATVLLTDLYHGPGLAGVPRGTVRALRLFTYHFAYHGMGGQVNRVGLDGPWDIKRVLGTVPVAADGSACFTVPANTPISLQPLDEHGQALQLMRSWLTAMPGEVVSCAGCHEPLNGGPPTTLAPEALSRPPERIRPFLGPVRGFSFGREVQPVLDAHCVRCHDGREERPDFRAAPPVHPNAGNPSYNRGTRFTPSYLALRAFVRGPSIESDMHLLTPCEYHAETTRLVQRLRAGHGGAPLDAEGWDRLLTWIDLGTPAHGTWHEIVGSERVAPLAARRRENLRRYAGRDDDPEAVVTVPYVPGPALPPREVPSPPVPRGGEWVFAAASAAERQASPGLPRRDLDLGAGTLLPVVRIPAPPGDGGRPFWMGTCEVSNRQFACFDPDHDSRIESGDFLHFSERERGYPVNGPEQPVCRVSAEQADAFCRWLGARHGAVVSLPTALEWEWACRAGTATPLNYGPEDADFARHANLADRQLHTMPTFGWGLPSGAVPPWRPAIPSVDDGFRVSAPVMSYTPNRWGLHDMHGNVAEWTADTLPGTTRRLVRGGSWNDRPAEAAPCARRSHNPWQRVFDVGFRIVLRDPDRP